MDLLRARSRFATAPGATLPARCSGRQRLEALDAALARETYLDALGAALFAGDLASTGDLLDVSRAVGR